jgi:hypothetical protein
LRIAAERDPGREIETLGKDRDVESVGNDDVFAIAGVEQHLLAGTQRIARGRPESDARPHENGRDDDRTDETPSWFE